MDKKELIDFINMIQLLSKTKQQEIYLMIKGAIWVEQKVS